MAPFRDGLRAAGYVEGQNIVIECRGGAQARDRLDDLAAELARLKVDVLIAEGTIGTLTAKRATSTIPIVMVYVADPVGSGLVASLAHPGGNVTGLSVLPPGLVQKAHQILKEIAPRVSRMAVWMDATNPGQTHLDEELDAAAKILGITLQRTDIRNAAGLNGPSQLLWSNGQRRCSCIRCPSGFLTGKGSQSSGSRIAADGGDHAALYRSR